MTWLDRTVMDWDPWREMQRLQSDVNRLFTSYDRAATAFPALNVWSDEQRAVVAAEVPGLAVNDVQLTVNNRVLTLEGERRADPEAEGTERHRQERACGAFNRSVRLPFEVDESRIKATLRHGVLVVDLPRRESTKPKAIAIAAE